MKTVPLEELRFESFARWVQTKFRVGIGPDQSVELKLIEVTPPRLFSAGAPNAATYESFSVIFAGPPDRLLPQGTYRFESEQAGCFELFIVPIGRDKLGHKYEAAFNRQKNGG